jgi:hypothetical protein
VAVIALMMETASSSQTLADFYGATLRYNPEDNRLHTRRRENLKSHAYFILLYRDFLHPRLLLFENE